MHKDDSNSDVFLGIDIGGTNTVLGFVDYNGNFLFEDSFQTNADDVSAFINYLQQKIREILKTEVGTSHLKGIGIGAPNGNYFNGTIENPSNLQWGNVPIVSMLQQYFPVPIAVTNDANAAAMGEMKFGAARGMKNFIQITLGTGLGSGIVLNGEIFYGADGMAGEIGHTIVYPDGRQCNCGRKGCLETYASASGLCRTVFELLVTEKFESELRAISFDSLTSKKIAEAAQKGDPLAIKAFESCGQVLGMALADTVAYFNPEAIILTGGLAQAGDILFEPTKRSFENSLLYLYKARVKLLMSDLLRKNSACLGAAALVINEIAKNKNE